MHFYPYLLTLAENEEDAKSLVESWIEERYEKEFFDYGGLAEDGEVRIVDDVIGGLEESRRFVEEHTIPEIIENIEKYKNNGNRGCLGFYFVRLGLVLQEGFCVDMPFFNISEWDWSIPTDKSKGAEGCNWYAVRVDLHY